MDITLKISGLDKLRNSLSSARQTSAPVIAQAINASLLEVQKQAIDENFNFIAPRSKRTGMLQLSFKYGFTYATEQSLKGGIGPTANYAIYVHEGTSRGIQPNPYMVRIAAKAEPKINELFGQALEKINQVIGNQS